MASPSIVSYPALWHKRVIRPAQALAALATFIPNELDASLSHDQAGMVAMANSGPDPQWQSMVYYAW